MSIEEFRTRSLREKLIYFAGLFDGEGTFSIQLQIKENKRGDKSPNFSPKMTMTLKYGSEILNELVDVFGGTVYLYDNGQNRWSLNKRSDLIVAAEALQPFLYIKHDICKRFLEALQLFPANRVNHFSGERSWSPEAVKKVAEIAFTLNPSSARKSKQSLDDIDFILSSIYNVDAILVKNNCNHPLIQRDNNLCNKCGAIV